MSTISTRTTNVRFRAPSDNPKSLIIVFKARGDSSRKQFLFTEQSDQFLDRILALKVQGVVDQKPEQYNSHPSAYDLAQIRGRDIVARVGSSRRYTANFEDLRRLCDYVVLRDKVPKPMMAGGSGSHVGQPLQESPPLDLHSQNLPRELETTFGTLGVAG